MIAKNPLNSQLTRLSMRFFAKEKYKMHKIDEKILHNERKYQISNHSIKDCMQIKKSYFRKQLSFNCAYRFTSSSNPSVVGLLEEITGKVLETIKSFKPQIFVSQNEVSSSINLKQRKLQQLGFDSLDVMELIVSLEEQISIQLTEEEVLKLDTIEKIIDIFFMKANLRVMNKMVQVQDKDTANIKIFRQ